MSAGHRLAAYGELFKRYGQVLRHSWRDRAALRGPVLSEDEAAFLPAALALQERPVSPTLRVTARVLMLLVGCVVLWAVFGQVDIIVNAAGKIIPSGNTKTIASVDVAAVRALHVREGQAVQAGQLLVELDSRGPDAERDKAAGDAVAAALQMARSRALIVAIDTLNTPKLAAPDGVSTAQREEAQGHLDGQYASFRARLAHFDGEIARYAQALPLAARRAGDYRALLATRDVAEHAWLEKEQARIDLAGQLASARSERAALVAQTRKDAYDALTEGARVAAASGQDARRAGARGSLLRLTAPVDGTVQQLKLHTVGGVVPAAQALMQIVPRQGRLEIDAVLENRDVGFVQEGQAVAVKVDAFDYTKYGTVPAVVRSVSRDAIEDEKKGLVYAVKITLQQPAMVIDGRLVPLSAGMAVRAEIRTGTRRVIEYVLSPLVQHQKEALHER
ncbi:HlyD family type I secretion periplasmic adaptor subunit [Janthinobacterium sp. EB271-G4-7A]|uniref:HlyD family type I secretion periplasmic adaptor subunit n=1 Tax=Janthinobacterium sp. EB271-G4-7A TaxID=2775056 RepID=UPI001E2AA00E|nr:HlyD family type I secretion periplasmic adaptor subunit [Janthinobacterium sp. EB271-G4-7A]MCC7697580.1 HlyD family type I secretion periplasmic adaptor subunit [Janthinobacterium sp. EB271-G4-7A]